MTNRLSRCLALVALLVSGACSSSPRDDAAHNDPSVDSVRVERDSTETYELTISYPTGAWMESSIGDAIRAWTAERRREFIASSPDSLRIDGFPVHPWELHIHIRTPMQTDVFTSLLAEGYEYTGGAHGMPVHEAFNFEMESGRRLALDDLFPDSTALGPISKFVRDELRVRLLDASELDSADGTAEREALGRLTDWIAEGTAPLRAHYGTFYLVPTESGQAAGITFVIPPYQVAPYAAGTQEVFVPTAVLGGGLNPELRGGFSEEPAVGQTE